MRLINTYTLKFEEFEGQNVPSYGILSHRWEEQEVLYKDVEHGTAITKRGWQKITKFCEQVREDGLSYAWVDTCCIDKSSSAELTEAINSMFQWYQRSKKCYVYLCDVYLSNSIWRKKDNLLHVKLPELSREFVKEFCSSVWFTRGWTLQELLASRSMMFFGHDWQILGTKSFLCAPITHTTCVPGSILTHEKALDSVTIAERLSWAAKRNTTRIEDRAYSLMGIFGVHMPMLYGEGEAAFLRLQEEILKRSNDQSILLWDADELGLLAKSPAAFNVHLPEPGDMSNYCLYPFGQLKFDRENSYSSYGHDMAFALTNTGLSIKLHLIPWYLDIYLVPLDVARTIRSYRRISYESAYIYLKQVHTSSRLSRVRFNGEALTYINENTGLGLQMPSSDMNDESDSEEIPRTQCVVAHEDLPFNGASGGVEHNVYGIHFAFEPNECWGPEGILRAGDVIARQRWSPTKPLITLEAGTWGVVAVIRVIHPLGELSYMYVGFDRNFNPCFVQKEWDHDITFDEIMEADGLSKLLDGWKFDKLTKHGGDEGYMVIKGDRDPFGYTLEPTETPGIWLEITRPAAGYLFDFRKRGLFNLLAEFQPRGIHISSKADQRKERERSKPANPEDIT